MRIRWSRAAADDLEQIFSYIRSDSFEAAQRVVQTIYNRIEGLANHPNQGRSGRAPGTRELPLTSLPFIVVYRVQETANAIEIVTIVHGAQRWPPAL
jgi:toxin ParE1/3/4